MKRFSGKDHLKLQNKQLGKIPCNLSIIRRVKALFQVGIDASS